jgi:photosystem II stability/assembly factor-like uncharacterized protein
MKFLPLMVSGLILATMTSPLTAAESKSAVERPAMMSAKASRALMIDMVQAGNRLVAVGDRGHILYSDDNAKTWIQAKVPVSVLLTSVYFVNANEGWAVGHNGVILYSSDAGQSWQLQHDDQQASGDKAGAPLLGVWFADNRNGFAVGAYDYFLVTHDGGTTWEDNAHAISNPDGLHLNAIKASPDGNTVFIVGEGGILIRSQDHGQTWTTLTSPFDGSFFGITPLTANQVLVFGLQGRLFASNDAGRSWQKIETGVSSGLNATVRLSNNNIVVAGNAGVVLRAADESLNLIPEPRPDRQSITSLIALPNGSLVTAGEGGLKLIPAAAK